MSEQKLAVVGRIEVILPIDGADRIKRAIVNCADAGTWSGVVGLDFSEGQLVTVFLQDALLPEKEAWEFMRRHKWRVRMARFKGAPSECVIVPLVLGDGQEMPEPGQDLAERLGVTKYSKPLPPEMSGVAAGSFPSFIPKTDETNFQAVPAWRELMESSEWVARVKCDGSSTTVWNDADGNLHVASRNLELKEFSDTGATNAYWRAARKYDWSKLPTGMAIQFELVGPGIQKNPLGLSDVEGRAFTLYDFLSHKRLSDDSLISVCEQIGIPVAFATHRGEVGCWLTAEDLQEMAKSSYENWAPAEGVVIRARDGSWSFKVLNLDYDN